MHLFFKKAYMDWGKNNFQAALQWPGCLFQRTLDVLSKVLTSSTIHQLQVISCLLENLSRAHKRRTPRKNNDASGRKFPIWTLWFWEAQYSPSPLGILLPGSRGLLQLSTTFTPSTSRRLWINCSVFPISSIICALPVAQKSSHDIITQDTSHPNVGTLRILNYLF